MRGRVEIGLFGAAQGGLFEFGDLALQLLMRQGGGPCGL